MRKLYWIVLAGSLGSVAGCNEIVTNGERTTAIDIDVVGEPSDPTNESLGQKRTSSGSALPMPDDLEAVERKHYRPNALQPQPFPDDPSNDPVSADQVKAENFDGNRVAKPVSLKV